MIFYLELFYIFHVYKKSPTNLPSVHFFPVPEELQT